MYKWNKETEPTAGDVEDALKTSQLLYKFYFTQEQIRQIVGYYLRNEEFMERCPDAVVRRHANFWSSGEIKFSMRHTYVNDNGELRLPYIFETFEGKTLDCGDFGPKILAVFITQALIDNGSWDSVCGFGDERFGKDKWKLNWFLGTAKKKNIPESEKKFIPKECFDDENISEKNVDSVVFLFFEGELK